MEISRKTLREVLTRVNKVIPRKANFDWMTCVFVDAKPDVITFSGVDETVSISVQVDGVGTTDQFLIDAHALKRVLDKGPKSETVTITDKITLGFVPFNIRQENPDDFRIDRSVDDIFQFETVGQAFDLLSDAMSDDVKRPYLQGVFADVRKSKIVSTNGERMYFCDLSNALGDCEGIIIPAKAVLTIAKLAKGQSVFVYGNESATRFVFGNTTIIAKNLDGAFPNWGAILDKKEACEFGLSFSTEAAIPIVDALSVSHAFMDLKVRDNCFSICGYELPSFEATINAEARIQTNYLSALLVKASELAFRFPRDSGPVFVSSPDFPGWTAAIMPSTKREVA